MAVALWAVLISACVSGGAAKSGAEPALTAASGYDPRLHAAPPPAPSIASPLVVPLDARTLSGFPREVVTVNAHGSTLLCRGISLVALLHASGAIPDGPLRGAQRSRYVLVQARDGDRVLFSLAELDPSLGNRKVFITDCCKGKPLPDEDGPLLLIVPGDVRPARWLRQVQSITVIVAP